MLDLDFNARDVDTMARTLFGEARGENRAGRIAVAWVIVNRVRAKTWFGKTLHGVCRKAWQFSCWNANDPNRPKIERVTLGNRAYRGCCIVVARVLLGLESDPTKGADHYHTRAVAPRWSRGKRPCAVIGHHLFYNDIG